MIRQLINVDQEQIKQLTDGLLTCVKDGASLGFLASVTYEKIHNYWLNVVTSLNNDCILLVAEKDELVTGSVQISLCHKDNGKHRGEVQKLFVLPEYRSTGLATQLMEKAEKIAIDNKLSLLILDTETGSNAESFYQKNNYVKVGDIPSFALNPQGEMSGTSMYYKLLRI
jgi:ribosomal protein S18 acetylase RimI-like enzyme